MFLTKKTHITFFVSALVHIFLLIILFLMPVKKIPPLDKKPVKVIKSYLYKKPLQFKRINEEIKNEHLTTQTVVVKKTNEGSNQKIKSSIKPLVKIIETDANIDPLIQSDKIIAKKTEKFKSKFSAYKQLNALKKSINDKIVEQSFQQQQEFRSPSVMHGKPIPVPHSQIKLTPSQIKEKNTVRVSDSLSITKHDNGTCTIERKQFLGSPVLESVAMMACGESKFDKNFREHMKKVQQKIMPYQ